jgi:hypothetical protein
MASAIINPDANHQTILSRLPVGAAAVDFSGETAIGIVNVIVFLYWFHLPHLPIMHYIFYHLPY